MKIHFIGIGGIGVSALAKYYLENGVKISGFDLNSSEITENFKKWGVKIFIQNSKLKYEKEKLKAEIKNSDLIIYSPAVSKDDWQIKLAKKIKIKCQSYPEALGELTKKYFTIAVCGTHGKSTTTALIGLILTKAKLDPTVIVGTKLREFQNSNCRVGKSKYLVIEADEHFASFLNYWPKIIVLTTLDPDHLDFYKNFKNYINAFKNFVSHLPKEGFLILNFDDKNIRRIFSKIKIKKNWYSLKEEKAKKIKKILKIPGDFNVSNAFAAFKVAKILKIKEDIILKALSQYRGSWRRLEEEKIFINGKNVKLISDYGHHPTEVKVTLEAIREKYKNKKILCVFQPHQYQRTYYLFNDFVKVFRNLKLDKIIITDIYTVPGREEESIIKKISSEKLVREIKKDQKVDYIDYIPKQKLVNFLKEIIPKFNYDILVIMGAGDIYKLKDDFKNN
ncbi:MAG: UDP-N-acetylmuramate--L-alanine ligase [Minisyncoccia bacterium]